MGLGREAEFEQLFKAYYSRLVLFAKGILPDSDDATDCVLDAFGALWKNFDQIKNSMNVKSYLYTCVQNKCLNTIRHAKVQHKVDLKEGLDVVDESSVELRVIDTELHTLLFKALSRLESDARRVIELNVFEKMKLHEIAEKMDLTLNQVKALKLKALRDLKKFFRGNGLILNILIFLNKKSEHIL